MKAAQADPAEPDRLLFLQQISSPALPIGGFTYSQGLEAAVELRLICDEDTARQWISAQLEFALGGSEAPLWCLLHGSWQNRDAGALRHWNDWFHASRETQEMRRETEQMGRSLRQLAHMLCWGDDLQRALLDAIQPATLPLVHSFACVTHGIAPETGLAAYLFTWLENQVAAAIKSIPLGQLAGQRIIAALRPGIPGLVADAGARAAATPPRLHTLVPQASIVSSRHASQFSRLFRS